MFCSTYSLDIPAISATKIATNILNKSFNQSICAFISSILAILYYIRQMGECQNWGITLRVYIRGVEYPLFIKRSSLFHTIRIKKCIIRGKGGGDATQKNGQAILSLFDETNSKADIAQKAKEAFPLLFKTYSQVEQFVNNLIE